MLDLVDTAGFRTGLLFREAKVGIDLTDLELAGFLAARVTGWFSLSRSMSWNVTLFFAGALEGWAGSISADSPWTFDSDSVCRSVERVARALDLAARVVFAAGFSFASELTVVAVALVDRVTRFGFSASPSVEETVSFPAVVSAFFGRPRAFEATGFVAVLVCSSVVSVASDLLRVARVARRVGTSGLADLVSSLSRGVTLTRRRGAAAKLAGAEVVLELALVRAGILKLLLACRISHWSFM